MNLRTIYLSVFISFALQVFTQERSALLRKYDTISAKEKVQLIANLSPDYLKRVYAEVQDTLDRIRQLTYDKNKEARHFFDLIEANLERGHRKFDRAIFITENNLHEHTSNVHDSLRCYSVLKQCFMSIRNFSKAYEINSKMEKLWPRKKESVAISFGVTKSGLLASLGFIEQAIIERRNEFNRNTKKHDTDEVFVFCSDMGIYFNRLKRSDSAGKYFLKALRLMEHKKYGPERQMHYEFQKAVTKGNLGLSYFNSGHVEKAIPLLQEDIFYSRKTQHFESLFMSFKVMAECYMRLGRDREALAFIDSASRTLEKHFPDGIQRQFLFQVQAKFFESRGDYKLANYYLNRYYTFRDSIGKVEKEQNLKNSEVMFRIDQKELELQEKNQMLKQKQLEEARNRTFRAYMIAGLLLLLCVVVFLGLVNYYSARREKELYAKNEQIRLQKEQIEQSLKEKEVLIREIHHRVKNNLQIITSMLSLQISREEGSESEATLREARQRISSIALTHQMLYQNDNLSSIPINEYIEKLVRQIEASLPPSDIQVETKLQANDRKVTIDNAIPLGLLINELLTNCFKHAFPATGAGQIEVRLELSENECVIGIHDNGIGLPANYNSGKKSMGMDLIHILAEQLDARLKVESKGGTSFTLHVPANRLFI